MYFLLGRRAIRIPDAVVPGAMHHRGDVTISLSRLVHFLADRAETLGVEVYHGFSARRLLVEEDRVVGVAPRRTSAATSTEQRRPTTARPRRSGPGSRSWPTARTACSRPSSASASAPVATRRSTRSASRRSSSSPARTASARAAWSTPWATRTPRRVRRRLHVRHGREDRRRRADPRPGLEVTATSPPSASSSRSAPTPSSPACSAGSVTIATGAKTIPEGGYFALGRLAAPGALVVGDGAGFVNMEKIKGIHYADPLGHGRRGHRGDALTAGEAGETPLAATATGSRSAASWGISGTPATTGRASVGGSTPAPRSRWSSALPGRLAHGARTPARRSRGARLDRRIRVGWTGATFVSLTGALHREDEPSHVRSSTPPGASSARETHLPPPARTSAPARSTAGTGRRSSSARPTACTA